MISLSVNVDVLLCVGTNEYRGKPAERTYL